MQSRNSRSAARLLGLLFLLLAAACVQAQDVSHFTFDKAKYIGGTADVHHGRIYLTSKALVDTPVALDWSNSDAELGPATVVVPAGSTWGGFTFITPYLEPTDTPRQVNATLFTTVSGGYIEGEMKVTSFIVNATKLVAGYTYMATITLNAIPADDQYMDCSSDNSDVVIPNGTIYVLGGTNTISFSVVVADEPDPNGFSFLDVSFNGSYKYKKQAIVPIAVASLTVDAASLTGGSSTTGHVTLSAAPSHDVTVTLSSSKPYVMVAGSITIPAGSTTGSFTINTSAVAMIRYARVYASVGTLYVYKKNVLMTVNP